MAAKPQRREIWQHGTAALECRRVFQLQTQQGGKVLT